MSAKPKASGGASAQILSTNQEILELCKSTNDRVTDLENRFKDTTLLLESLEKKLDNARLASTSKARGGTAKASGKKDESKTPTVPPINIWFRQLWKDDPEGTIEKYCDPDAATEAEAEVKKNPTHAKKEGAALNMAVAGFYYTKYFAKPNLPTFDKEGRDKLKADHEALKASLEKGEGNTEADNDSEGNTEGDEE